MSACTFFGHRDAPSHIRPLLRAAIIDLIEKHAVDHFYVGRQGAFDAMVQSVFRELRPIYPKVRFYVVLERMPGSETGNIDTEWTLLPEGIELAPPRFAIVRRNEWMLKSSDYVITYVCRSFGGAAHFMDLAIKRGKTVIRL